MNVHILVHIHFYPQTNPSEINPLLNGKATLSVFAVSFADTDPRFVYAVSVMERYKEGF